MKSPNWYYWFVILFVFVVIIGAMNIDNRAKDKKVAQNFAKSHPVEAADKAISKSDYYISEIEKNKILQIHLILRDDPREQWEVIRFNAQIFDLALKDISKDYNIREITPITTASIGNTYIVPFTGSIIVMVEKK